MRATAPAETIHRSIEHLQRLSDLLAERRHQLAVRVGLNESQWEVLEEISTEHFIPSLFAKRRESSPAAVSKVLRQLLDKGLVRVSVSDADGRQRNYELSAKGQKVMDRLRQHRQHAIDAIWAELPADDLQRFNSFSGELIARIERFAALEAARGGAVQERAGARNEARTSQRANKLSKSIESPSGANDGQEPVRKSL